jgi:peroxiredoxin
MSRASTRFANQGWPKGRSRSATEHLIFELANSTGKTVKLLELTARGPVVLTWYRGGWCPDCNVALRGFQKSLSEFRAAGATLAALSPEMPAHNLSAAEKNHLEFEVLSDRNLKVAHAFNVAYKSPDVVTA